MLTRIARRPARIVVASAHLGPPSAGVRRYRPAGSRIGTARSVPCRAVSSFEPTGSQVWHPSPRRWAELLLRGQVPGVGNRGQLVESTRKVLALNRRCLISSSCRRTIRPQPSGGWRAEAGGNHGHSITRGPTRNSRAPLLRLRGRVGRRGRPPPQPSVPLRLRRPERAATAGAPSPAQGRLPILSVRAEAWEAPSPRAVSAFQSDGHARRSGRSGAGTRQTPAESWLHGVRRPLRRSLPDSLAWLRRPGKSLAPGESGGPRHAHTPEVELGHLRFTVLPRRRRAGSG
jgi:hypothetical protein